MIDNIEAPWIGKHKEDDEMFGKVVHICECNDCEIYEGEDYYDINGTIICEYCIHEYLKTAEVDDV